MKFFILFLFLISPVFGVEVKFFGPCQDVALFKTHEPLDIAKSVGHYTIEVLEREGIDYIGSPRGLNSIFKTPIGDGALEILSDTEMRAYGWCYKVSDFEPGVYADEYFLSSNEQEIVWFYGFAHYKDGDWVAQCVPANKIKPDFLCR